MDIRERIDDPEENIRAAIDQRLANFWTSAMGRVVSYDAAKQTASIQLTVKSYVKQEDGTRKAVDIPVLQDVPVQFPGSGGQTMTFPVKTGDEVMVNFMSRASDAQQQSGGDQSPPDASIGGLSHPRAMLGFKSAPKALQNVSTTATEIRSDDGNTKIGISGDGGVGVATDKSVSISAAAGVSMTGGAGGMTFTGTMNVTGDIVLNGISLKDHKHTGVAPGGGTSAGPTIPASSGTGSPGVRPRGYRDVFPRMIGVAVEPSASVLDVIAVCLGRCDRIEKCSTLRRNAASRR